jgi:6-hydroxymethylpterin diphosphokinase MptE-like protein
LSSKPALSSHDRQILARNVHFKNKHRNQRAFVIGNGPSLARQDLTPLRDEITFTLSGFWKHTIIEQWQPTYYCFSDPVMFDGSPVMKEFFRNLTERVTESTFFVPLSALKRVQEHSLLPVERTYYVAFHGDLSTDPVEDIDLTTAVPGIMNVAQLCMMVAVYMGISPIYLLGLDHDWLSHTGENKHFYTGHAGLEKHPEVRPVLSDWSYRHLMECQLIGWKAYENLARVADRSNIKIFNATDGGFLDVYERARYQEIL